MFRTMKKIMEMNKSVTDNEIMRDDDNRVLVNISVRDDSNFISPFSFNSQPVLSSEVTEFFESSLRPKHFGEDLHIKIYSDCIDEKEKTEYSNAIKNTFRRKYLVEKQTGRRDLFVSIMMLVIGIIFLTAIVMLDYYNIGGIVIEIVDIIAWVFMWEAADIFFLQRTVHRWQKIKCVGFYSAHVTFAPLKEQNNP